MNKVHRILKSMGVGTVFLMGFFLIVSCSNVAKTMLEDGGAPDTYLSGDSVGEEGSASLSGATYGSYSKQKVLYATPIYMQKLDKKNSYDVQVSVTFDSLKGLRDYGDRAIYEATAIGIKNGPWGYFGPQVFGNKGKSWRDMILFSFWDSKAMALPINEEIDGNCERNCQDGNCGGVANGTKCTLPYPMEDGVEYTMRLQRIKEVATVGAKSGSVWQLSVTNQRTNETKIVGKMLFVVGVAQGISKMNFFHEHIGETPCGSFPIKAYVKSKVLDSHNPMMSAVGTVTNDPALETCPMYNVSGDKTSQMFVFETGTGVRPGFLPTEKKALF